MATQRSHHYGLIVDRHVPLAGRSLVASGPHWSDAADGTRVSRAIRRSSLTDALGVPHCGWHGPPFALVA